MTHGKRFFAPIFLALAAALATAACADCSSDKKETRFDQTESGKLTGETHGLTPEQASQVLVKVGDRTITVGEFASRLADRSPYLRARFQSADHRREFLDNMVRFELLSIEAEKRGYHRSEEVKKVRDQKMVQRMMEKLFDEGGEQISDITEDEIKAYYEKNRHEYHKPEQVRASHILLAKKQEGQRVLKRLGLAPGDGQLFRSLAASESIDEKTKHRGGDLRFFSRASEKTPHDPDVPDAIREAAFTLKKKGDVYPSVIATDQGFHVLQLTDRRQPYDRSLEEARRSIQNRLWRNRREETIEAFVQKLREKAKVELHPDLLDQLKLDIPEKGQPPRPDAPAEGSDSASSAGAKTGRAWATGGR